MSQAKAVIKKFRHTFRTVLMGIYILDTYPEMSTEYRIESVKLKIMQVYAMASHLEARYGKDVLSLFHPNERKLILMFLQFETTTQ